MAVNLCNLDAVSMCLCSTAVVMRTCHAHRQGGRDPMAAMEVAAAARAAAQQRPHDRWAAEFAGMSLRDHPQHVSRCGCIDLLLAYSCAGAMLGCVLMLEVLTHGKLCQRGDPSFGDNSSQPPVSVPVEVRRCQPHAQGQGVGCGVRAATGSGAAGPCRLGGRVPAAAAASARRAVGRRVSVAAGACAAQDQH